MVRVENVTVTTVPVRVIKKKLGGDNTRSLAGELNSEPKAFETSTQYEPLSASLTFVNTRVSKVAPASGVTQLRYH